MEFVHRRDPPSVAARVELCLQIAKGMAYLGNTIGTEVGTGLAATENDMTGPVTSGGDDGAITGLGDREKVVGKAG